MVDMTTTRKTVPAKQLLYDEARLETLVEEFGHAIEIKENVDTTAFIYEIRTAIEYWLGGDNSHRESDRVWSHCEAVDNGEFVVVGDEFKCGSKVDMGEP